MKPGSRGYRFDASDARAQPNAERL